MPISLSKLVDKIKPSFTLQMTARAAALREKGIDVINSRLSDVINNSGLLQNITNSWDLDSLPNGKLGVCAQKCGTEFDPFGEQFI